MEGVFVLRAKIVSFVLCLAAFGVSMWLMLSAVDPSRTEIKTNTGSVTAGTDETGLPDTGHKTEPPKTTAQPPVSNDPYTLEDASKAGADAEKLIEALAFDGAEYKSAITSVVASLREASSFLSQKSSNISASLYYSNLADTFEAVAQNPFSDMASFSTRVSDLLKKLDQLYPAQAANEEKAKELGEGEVRLVYPEFDTSVNGDVVLAMLSVYNQHQKTVRDANLVITVGGNLFLGDAISTGDGLGFAGELESNFGGDYKYPLYRLLPCFANDRLSILSLENPLTNSINLSDGIFSVKGIPDYVKMLSRGSVEAVTITTEHINDYGTEGVNETITVLDNAGIKNASELSNICYYDADGVKVAIISYNLLKATGTVFQDKPKADIATAKSNGAAFVICCFNWGNNNDGESVDYSTSIAGFQARTARRAIDNGANLVIGTHPHVMQALEKYKGCAVIYSPGDLSCAAKIDTDKASNESFLIRLSYTVNETVTMKGGMEIFPLLNDSGKALSYLPSPVFDGNADTVISNLIKYSNSSAYKITRNDISYIKITK